MPATALEKLMEALGKGGGSGAGSLGAQLKGLTPALGKRLGGFSFLRSVAATALGGLGAILAADVFRSALNGIKDFVAQGIDAVGQISADHFQPHLPTNASWLTSVNLIAANGNEHRQG